MKVGIDIEEVKRFKSLIKNKAFLTRVFSKEEINYCLSKKNAIEHFAVRFCGKEAVWKALNNSKIQITSISFKNLKSGKPTVLINNKKNTCIQVSFSHTKTTVVAVAIVL